MIEALYVEMSNYNSLFSNENRDLQEYTRNVNYYSLKYSKYAEFNFNKDYVIENLIKELKKISEYEIESYDYEKIDNEMIALGVKFKDFPEDKSKVAYSVELMNKLDNKLPDNIDIFVV